MHGQQLRGFEGSVPKEIHQVMMYDKPHILELEQVKEYIG